MSTILVLGAGRSSYSLITYLNVNAEKYQWQIVIGDIRLENAVRIVRDSPFAKAVYFDPADDALAQEYISGANVVISLLPPSLHVLVARHCLVHKKHLLTASYVSDEMRSLRTEAKDKQLLFLNECGLDPGIDHMTAMQVIHEVQKNGGHLVSFESFIGGLIAPETDPENPWRYKFTWNPRNVVTAGQSNARYLQDGKIRIVPYKELFVNTTPVHVDGYGAYEGYANRDSLSYIDTYNLKNIQTMIRGTLRNKGFCAAWNIFVQLGCCDDSYEMENVATMTHLDFINSFLLSIPGGSPEAKLAHKMGLSGNSEELQCLKWSGFFEGENIGLEKGTPAQILEHILHKKWKLNNSDIDMIVMWHRFVYTIGSQRKEVRTAMVVKGNDADSTAMAKTVGLPLAIAAKLLLTHKMDLKGVAIPIHEQLYVPILKELTTYGVTMTEYHL